MKNFIVDYDYRNDVMDIRTLSMVGIPAILQ